MNTATISLPLLPTAPDGHDEVAPAWQGLSVVGPLLEPATAAPEPDAPQGEYSTTLTTSVPLVATETITRPVELLAPAGGPEAGFAAFAYGADAIYLGLQKSPLRD